MNPPAFWEHDGPTAALLSPIARLVARATARRVARDGWHAPVPVLCCGNASVGGTGKTTLALDLAGRLAARGRRPAFLTRGYRGSAGGQAVRVGAHDDSARVGDEPLLLAAAAPTYVGRDRAEAARLAIADGAGVLVMDDGLQNPTLARDIAFLVVDGAVGFGNGRVIPAGPLREPVCAAAARCSACVMIGDDVTGATGRLPPDFPVLTARLQSDFDPASLPGAVFAFAGIGRPGKFFASLREAGASIAGYRAFPDHHRFGSRDLADLAERAARLGARLVTTPKDFVRLPASFAAGVTSVGVRLRWNDEATLERWLP